jgi:hypothetical protein
MGRADVRLCAFLVNLNRFVSQATKRISLLPFRKDFRKILTDSPIAALVWFVAFGDGVSARIAVWLLSQLHYPRAVGMLIAYGQHADDPALRRRVAQAFRSLRAWQQLREMASVDNDPIVRRVAGSAVKPPTAFPERLSKFLHEEVRTKVAQSTGDQTRPALFLNATPGVGRPPRRPWFIRLILHRIHQLVRGDTEAEPSRPKEKQL